MPDPEHPSRVAEEGLVELRSTLLSNAWRMTRGEATLAVARRYPGLHLSRVALSDGTIWTLEPEGWGVVRALEEEVPFAHATRISWSGRRWEVGGVGFSYRLRSTSIVLRRWVITEDEELLVRLRGGLLTYNRVRAEVIHPIPIVALLLAWHVMARPWEAAAAPRLLLGRGTARPWPAG